MDQLLKNMQGVIHCFRSVNESLYLLTKHTKMKTLQAYLIYDAVSIVLHLDVDKLDCMCTFYKHFIRHVHVDDNVSKAAC